MSIQPADIEIVRDSHVRIRWSDGLISTIPVETLRRNCPCATCRATREQVARNDNPLRVLQQPASVQDQRTIAEAELVGRYALRIRWSDGHDTGIFDYQLLRALGASEAEPPGHSRVKHAGSQISS